MRQILLLFVTISFLHSCRDDNDFQKIYNSLPEVPLPLTIHTPNGNYFTPDLEFVTDERILDHIGYKGYAKVCGRLFVNDNYKAALINLPTDVGTPMIFTFNHYGLKIDSIELFDTRPATTIGLISRETVNISQNGIINFVDSSTYLDDYDKPYKFELIRKVISIDKIGHFHIKTD